ncbi:AAA+ ATPase domain [Syntrophomonas zehnderi OL-4]|uniref:AAA+ ATPase domain n=1 Tax=Syntrophomonas zehnderi OL-4 TaxID=690567 RepID=A0A0E4GAM9_9FIRM|nr:ATP-binding protein [Syntrophomonas zehnderi]CFX16343.1 AAA+ ATPase domain [Syntrophomonas zehnderi OL-4]
METVKSGILDALTPQALEFQTNYIQFGDLLGRVMVITDYPPQAGTAWLARITQIPGVAASLHVSPTNAADLIEDINKAIGEYMGRLNQGGNALIIQRTEQALKDADSLLKKIDQEQQNVFYLTVLLFITAMDMDNLILRTRRVESALAAAGMRGRTLLYRQEQGLKSIGPWATLDPEMLKAGGRNMPSETIAASFPFVAGGLNDIAGIMLGRDRDGGLVILDMWMRSGDRTNSNWTILGKPGTGKSYLAKMLLLREYAKGARIIIIDPEREYRKMCQLLGGSWVNVAGGQGRINPLQVRSVPLDQDDDEEKSIYDAQSPLGLHLQILRTFFSLYLRDLTDVERAVLEDSLLEVYHSKEIDFNTQPENIQVDVWPTMNELYEYVLEQEKTKPELFQRLAILLKRAAKGADAAMWNGFTTATADKDFIVLDVHELQNADDAVKRAQYFNVLSYVWNLIEQDREERIILLVDEAWMLVDDQTPQALAFLRDTSKRIRKYMGSLIVASQNVIDFLDPAVARHGQALLDNPTYKILLGQGDKDLQALTTLMQLTEAEQELLQSAKRGEGLLVAGNQRVHIRIESAPFEAPYLVGGGA